MTLEQCIDAFEELLNKNVTYNGNEAILTFDSHTMAIGTFQHARQALAQMHAIAYGSK